MKVDDIRALLAEERQWEYDGLDICDPALEEWVAVVKSGDDLVAEFPTGVVQSQPSTQGQAKASDAVRRARLAATAVNLLPTLLDAVEAAAPILERSLDFFGPDDLDPESSEAMPVVIKNRWAYDLRVALDAVNTAMEAGR